MSNFLKAILVFITTILGGLLFWRKKAVAIEPDKETQKMNRGRALVDEYRRKHRELYNNGWYKGISEDHFPILEKLVIGLENIGITSTETEYEFKKNEILAKFFNNSNELCLVETGIFNEEIRQSREDLFLISGVRKPSTGTLNSKDGVFIEISKKKYGIEARLFIDEVAIMWTDPDEQISMRDSVKLCPDNARVFIGGLGIGLVALYLVFSGKTNQIIICEKDDRVMALMGEKVKNYFSQNYPDIELSIIKGNAFEEVKKHGKFDWIYIDLSDGAIPEWNELAKPFLTERGIYTPFKSYSPSWK